MIETPIKNCWEHIGVGGDRSCPELQRMTHCRNCFVYAAAGRGLLDREASVDYLTEWTEVLSRAQSQLAEFRSTSDHHTQDSEHSLSHPVQSSDRHNEQTETPSSQATTSVMIVRLGNERLALPVRSLQEVTHPCVIHTLPHRSNALFLGLVNIRGEILLCVSLKYLLSLEDAEQVISPQSTNAKDEHQSKFPFKNLTDRNSARTASTQMIVVAQDENRWVFTVDEVCGFHRYSPAELQPVPVVVTKAATTFTQAIFDWQDHAVNLLDLDLLLYTLSRRIL